MPPDQEKALSSSPDQVEPSLPQTKDALSSLTESFEHIGNGDFEKFIESLQNIDLMSLFSSLMEKIDRLLKGDFSVFDDLNLEKIVSEESTNGGNETAEQISGAILNPEVPRAQRLAIGDSNFTDWPNGLSHKQHNLMTSELPGFGTTSFGGLNSEQIFWQKNEKGAGMNLNNPDRTKAFIEALKKNNIKEVLLGTGTNNNHFADPMPEPTPDNLDKFKETKYFKNTSKMIGLISEGGSKAIVCTPVAFEHTPYAHKNPTTGKRDIEHKKEWHRRAAYFVKLAWPNSHIDLYQDGKLSPNQKEKGSNLHPGGSYLANIIKGHFKGAKSKPAEKKEEILVGKHERKNVVSFGDSLAAGPGMGQDSFRNLGISGKSSTEILGRVGQLKQAKEAGATAVFISTGTNDGQPNRSNVQQVIDEATKIFGADNVVVATVPEYDNDPKYPKYASYKESIETHNQWLQEYSKQKGFKVYKYETGGLLHPKSYEPTRISVMKLLNTEQSAPLAS